ncbi:unnamed protein product [Acanthoscelides obtectus]|uniref:Uncharacterized protein n=1 Tax=Acanthoscelides obtectus TaxID=200917 RepID=A0A9P0LUJ9_ACAOB|nr:unnamed protein product [Acanthoscelides obtectus]CAK1678399.1 hypothetical protein AOBTE_LOCUS31869 [Acanthoscelides obtectus]
MYKPFFDDPVKTYGYYNFLTDALDDLKDDDDIVVLPPDAHYLTDEEELDENQLMANRMPQDVSGRLELFRQNSANDEFCSSDEEPLSEVRKRIKINKSKRDDLAWEKCNPKYSIWSEPPLLYAKNSNRKEFKSSTTI